MTDSDTNAIIRPNMGSIQEIDGFKSKNVPPKLAREKSLPVCPMFLVIEECAKLAGKDTEQLNKEPKFCGHNVVFEGMLDYKIAYKDPNPHACCAQISVILESQIALVKSLDPQSPQAKQILERWKVRYIQGSSLKIKPEKVSDQKAIHYAELFLESLMLNATGTESASQRLIHPGANCPKRPT